MVSALQEIDVASIDPIDEPMLFCDPARPRLTWQKFEMLWLTDSGKRSLPKIVDQFENALRDARLRFHPPLQVL
jgi:hypothetical protein